MDKMDKNKRRMWGRDFDVVPHGLDIAQVIAYIEEIRQTQNPDAHIDSLKRLAESTVAEADRIAQEIREEAKAEAKSKAIQIINEAEAKLQQVIKAKKQTEKEAQKKAIGIIADAEKQKGLIKRQARSLIEEASTEAAQIRESARENADNDLARLKEMASEKLRSDIRMVHQKLIADLVSLAAEVRILESKWEGLKIEDVEQNSEPASISKAKELNASPPADIQEYLQRMNGEVDNILNDNIKEEAPIPGMEEKDVTAETEETMQTGQSPTDSAEELKTPDSEPDEETAQTINEAELPEESGPVEEEELEYADDFFGIPLEIKDSRKAKEKKGETESEEPVSHKIEGKSKRSKTDTSSKEASPKPADTLAQEKQLKHSKIEESQSATFSDIEDLIDDRFGAENDKPEELMSIDRLRESLESQKANWKDHRLTSELEHKSPENPILKGLRGLASAIGLGKGKR